jgi:formamidopyrimidine-DNA glycosylase
MMALESSSARSDGILRASSTGAVHVGVRGSSFTTDSMPELPEVETIVRGLQRMLPQRRVIGVEVHRPDLIANEDAASFVAGLSTAVIQAVNRRAKNIVLELDQQRLVVNLGMTGRLLVVPADTARPSHLGVRFRLDEKGDLIYQDVRRFGRLQRFEAEAWRQWEERLGIEPLSAAFTSEALLDRCRRSRVAIKTWLMDQRWVVGVGNIYASEALFRAGIDPGRPARSLSAAEGVRLRAAIRCVLQEAIEYRGTTLLDYRDARGESGGFASRLRVYERAGRPCPACGAEIHRIVQGGRSTFFCAVCQS